MQTKVFLTPFDQMVYDPTGRARSTINRFRDTPNTPVPHPYAYRTRDEWLTEYIAYRNKQFNKKHSRIFTYDDQFISKFGGQGGNYSIETLEEQYATFFERAETLRQYRIAIIGRDYLIRLFRQQCEMTGKPSPLPDYRGTVGTNGALPTMRKKGSFIAETVGMTRWRHPIPNLPGQRKQRNKKRPVNQDANPNVRYIEEYVARMKLWLKTYFPRFVPAWIRPDVELQPLIYEFLKRPLSAIETDFDACDSYWGVENATEVVLPLYEVILNSMEYAQFFSFVEELFYQPIYMGNYMLTGKHNLLSGQVITNDFETLYDLCVVIGAMLDIGLVPEEQLILCNGDDVSIGTRQIKKAECLKERIIDEFILNGMKMSLEKCGTSEGEITFCKRYYYPGCSPERYNLNGRPYYDGVYPAVLTVNSIINPERYASGLDELVAMLQRLDNLYGSSIYEAIAKWLISNRRGNPFNGSYSELDQYRSSDWWDRLYGQLWCSADSYTVSLCKNQKLMLRY